MEAALDSFAHLGLLIRLTHPYACYTVPCHTFHDKVRLDKPQITQKKKYEGSSKIKKSHGPSMRNSCFDPKTSFSRLLKLTPLRRGLKCYNKY